MSKLRATCLMLALGAVLLSSFAILGEYRVARVTAALKGNDPLARHRTLAEAERWSPATTPTRAALGVASLWLAEGAAANTPTHRRSALSHAAAVLGRTTGPSQEASRLVLQSQIALQDAGYATRSSVAAFAASYVATPFLKTEGIWRIAYAASFWSQLAPGTRDAAVREAVWLAGLDANLRSRLEWILGGSPMAVRVQLRLTPTSVSTL